MRRPLQNRLATIDDGRSTIDDGRRYTIPPTLRRVIARHLKDWTYSLVAREISRIARYADRVVHVDPLPPTAWVISLNTVQRLFR